MCSGLLSDLFYVCNQIRSQNRSDKVLYVYIIYTFMDKRFVTVRGFDKALFERVREYAYVERKTIADVMNAALKEYLDEHEKTAHRLVKPDVI